LIANPPLALNAEQTNKRPADLLFTDASDERWCAVHIRNDVLRIYAEDWTAEDRKKWNLASSVASEPLAIRKALCRAVSPNPDSLIAVTTDHQPIVDARGSPCARAFA
jgi:hypothetical protein